MARRKKTTELSGTRRAGDGVAVSLADLEAMAALRPNRFARPAPKPVATRRRRIGRNGGRA